ncbi:MAG TPA: hypothetical protein DCZ94_10215 [Lentisphaeria bacterium]|nr:MAG: hypothetical protein A2X48_11090 [Lentisphaerae bacterium GWF2_49_21]HBC87318.1 hypothetical protein [Lentisphaeria bacterium]
MDNLKLPESLSLQLRGFQRKLRAIESVTAAAAAFCMVAGAFSFLYLSDRLWDTPVILRIILFLCGFVPLLYLIFYTIHHVFMKRRDFKTLSVLVQKHHRKLGDSLLGVVELAENKDLSENVSKELCSAAITNIAEKSQSMDFCEAISRKGLRRFAVWSFAILAVVVCMLIFTRPAFGNALIRWLNPLSSVERYTFVKFDGIPQSLNVPHGEEFEIKCVLDSSSTVRPENIKFRCGMEPAKTVTVAKDSALLRISGQTKPVDLKIWSGDFRKTVKIIPLHRPVLLNLEAAVKLPEYTGRKDEKVKLSGKTFQLLEGSQYSFEGKIDRDIKSAELVDASGKTNPLRTQGSSFFTEQQKAVASEKNVLTWLDSLGMRPLHPFEYSVVPEKDQEPFTECPKLPLYSAMLADETIIIQVTAEDDYGVAELGASYSSSDPKIETKIYGTASMMLAKGAADKQKLEAEFMFCPALLKIEEKTLVTVCSTAKDYFPSRTTIYSKPYRIYILSLQEHAKLVEEELESIMAKIEDLVWREEENLEKNKNISKLSEEEMKNDETSEKISEQENSEKMNAEDLEKLSEKAVKMLEEALKNKEFPAKTIKEWAKMLDTINQVSKNDMKNVEKSLKNAQSESKRSEQMKKAVKEQQELLEKLKELMKKMDESLNNLTMENFVSRLKKEAENEKAISSKLAEIMKTSVGMDQNTLPEKIRNEITDQKSKQEQIRKIVKNIQDDLLGFFSRTRIKKYQDVSDEMEKEKIQKKLEDTVETIAKNQTAKGISSTKEIAAKLEKWADDLGKKDNKQAGGGGEGGGEMKEIDPEILIGLMRLLQQEQELREQTRNLDENREKMKDYGEKSVGLSEKQMGMRNDLGGLKKKAADFPKLIQLMDQTGKAMTDAGALLFKPQTDQQTIGAETEVIELLAASMQNASEMSEGSGEGSEMMSMLMQMMMGGQGGMRPGGFKGSISSNAANTKSGGETYKPNLPEGKPERTAGASTKALPEEYKDAIETYFNRVNSIDKKNRK